jgi:hypothetical protein
MLTFAKKSHAYSVLQKGWFMESSPTILKLWNPTFDVDNERLDSIPIWVKLPGLPPHIWNEKCFQAIKNHLGDFITAYMSFLDTGEMAVARILVLLNIREGLKEFLNLIDQEPGYKFSTSKESLSIVEDVTNTDTSSRNASTTREDIEIVGQL